MSKLKALLRARRGYSVGEMPTLALVLVIVAITVALGLLVLANMQDTMTADSAAANATGEGIDGLAELASWLPIIALVIAAGIVIGIVVRSLRVSGGGY